jgi:hypothetical protein
MSGEGPAYVPSDFIEEDVEMEEEYEALEAVEGQPDQQTLPGPEVTPEVTPEVKPAARPNA